MIQTFDSIVLGAGAMGAATAYHLTKIGQKVLLLEQFELDHQKGSSQDVSRIIRYSYDHPVYIKLAKAVYPLWFALEDECGETLYTQTGGIDFGPATEATLKNTQHSLKVSNIPYEVLTPPEAQKRFPQFHFQDDWQIIYQPDSGFLAASQCTRVLIELSQKYGAVVKANTPVLEIETHNTRVSVKTEDESYSAAHLIITAGSWAKSVLASTGINLPIQPERCQLAYFLPPNLSDFEPANFPVFIAHLQSEFGKMPYGLPSYNQSGVKIAYHGGQRVNHPSEVDYTADSETVAAIRKFTHKYLPAADAPLRYTRICLYTMSPDEHFIIDKHPTYPHIVYGAGFSGHGFKFAILLGKILCDLAVTGQTDQDISLFSISRFTT